MGYKVILCIAWLGAAASLIGLATIWVYRTPTVAFISLGFAAMTTITISSYHFSRRASIMSYEPSSRVSKRSNGSSAAALELLSKALIDVGSQDLAVRMAAIAALEPLAQHPGNSYRSVAEMLVRFVRSRTYLGYEESQCKAGEHAAGADDDVQAALSVLGRLHISPADRNSWYDLSYLDLRRSKLRRLDFSGANLRGTILDSSDLGSCSFRGADLRSASLRNLRALDVSFKRSIMQDADLSDAVLIRADLTGTILAGARLTRAFMHRAKMNEALLLEADLTDAVLSSASAKAAYFSGATFDWANLLETDLRGSNIRQEQLRVAHVEKTLVEDGSEQGRMS
jgi:uncharacterized protein YjbI with pentapeptide repeats